MFVNKELMKLFKKKENTSTTSTDSTITESKKSNRFLSELKIWWPVVILTVIMICAGIFKYISPNLVLYDLSLKLIKAIGVLMIMFYVIYTRLLAVETKKMAVASMGLYQSEKGTVLTEIREDICEFKEVCDDVKGITEKIHIEDKRITEREFKEIIKDSNLTAVKIKIKNRSGRRIDVNKIEFEVRHTGKEKFHSVLCNISEFGTIGPWEDIMIPLIVAPEGEVEVIVNWIYYLDGGVVQKKNVTNNQIIIERIRKPEN